MIVWLLVLWFALVAFYGYLQSRKFQDIMDDKPHIPLFSNSVLTPKEYGIKYANGKSRIKKSNRLRLSK